MVKKRIFIALPVSANIKNKVVGLQKKIGVLKGVKWESKKKLHLTLHFLGYLEDREINQVKAWLNKVRFEIINANLAGFDFFPSEKHARVVVLKINSENKIEELQKIIGEGLLKYKFFKPEKRKFKAHLTFGRIKRIYEREIDLIKKERLIGSFKVKKIVLMQSVLKKMGSEYIVLEEYNL